MKSRYLASIILFLCLCCTLTSKAQETDQAGSVSSSRGGNEFSWDISITIDMVYESTFIIGTEKKVALDFLELDLLIDVYYRGFFFQSNKHRYNRYDERVEIGYELAVNENYEIDLISKIYLTGFSASGLFDNGEPIEELAGINPRKYLSSQGIRYRRYLPNAVYWVDVATNLFSNVHDGWVIDGFYSYILQRRNWDINLGAGASFFSNEMNNYYFSVQPEEATSSRPVYQAGAGYRLQVEAFVQHPLSEAWLFTGGVTLSHYSNSISDSPLVVRDNIIRAQVGVRYVF
jgi:hypothetical protein